MDYIFGIQYYRAPTPLPEEWEVDLENIKKMGFNTIQLRPQWRWHERLHGQFYWDDLDRLFDLSEKNGLNVVFKFFLESAPAWLYREHNCERIDLNGNKILPGAIGAMYVGGWLPCFDHAMVRREANRFINEAVNRYKEKKSLIAWNVWNEPRSRPGGECCCEESKKSYRTWLKGKFLTIQALNNYLGKAWGEWEDIVPPPKFEDFSETYIWRQWAMWSVQDRLKWVYDHIKEIDKIHPVITHVGMCSPYQDILNDTSNDWMNAKVVDFYGSSLPYWTGEFHTMWDIEGKASFKEKDWQENFYIVSLIPDWIRSISNYFWINEVYSNNWYYFVKDLSPSDHNFWIWNLIACGAKGILFWQYKPERLGDESLCSGLVNLDGSETERSKEVEKIANLVNKYKGIFTEYTPDKADIAIVYDCKSDLISRIEDTTSDNRDRIIAGYRYKDAIKGIYAILWEMDTPVDFIPMEELEKIRAYPYVYLPCPIIMSQEKAEVLREYVKEGGTLISEMQLGFRDENSWVSKVRPNCGLDMIFGCRENIPKKLEGFKECRLVKSELKLKVTGIDSSFQLRGAEAIGVWDDGSPAITCNNFGKGKAILIGFHPGINRKDKNCREILKEIIPLKPKVEISDHSGLVLTKKGKANGKDVIFIFNYEEKVQNILLKNPSQNSIKDLFNKAKIRVENEKVYLTIPSREVVCLKEEN